MTPLDPTSVVDQILDRLAKKLADRGIDGREPWPVALLRLGLPGGQGHARPCVESLHRAIRRGDLPAVRIGRQWYTTADGVRSWLLGRATRTEATAAARATAAGATARVARRLGRTAGAAT